MHLEDTFEEKNVDKSIFFLQSFKIYFQSSLFNKVVQYTLDLRKILGVAKKFLKLRSFLFQTRENLVLPI